MNRSCRFCKTELRHTFADLGMSPLSNAFLTRERLSGMEPFYPLHAFVCEQCFLVQLEEFERPEHIFNDYVYFSSYSATWVEHARRYVEHMTSRFHFGADSFVVEIASNDGYLLRHWKARNVPVLGIEPAINVASVAIAAGIPTLTDFFGRHCAQTLAAEGKCADLIVGNNVLAHVPDLNDFVAGLKILLKQDGIITMEFPHLLQLIEHSQFDTIYHEHFSYLSLLTTDRIFRHHGLQIFDVEELSTHGGSLRIYARHAGHSPVENRVVEMQQEELAGGLNALDAYLAFAGKPIDVKCALLRFLIDAREAGNVVVGYGAPAKGNTLLNYCGIGPELLEYTVDLSPHKQGLFLPGTHIPVHAPERIAETRPDYVVVLPWNLIDEIRAQLGPVLHWGGKLVVPIPKVRIVE